MPIVVYVAAVVVVLMLVLVVREILAARRRPTSGAASESARPSVDAENNDLELTRLAARVEQREPSEGDSDLKEQALTVFESESQVGIDEPTGPVDLVLLSSAGQTDPGRKRRRNEDAYVTLDEFGLYAIADGMGGYAGGDVASKVAVDTISKAVAAGGCVGKADPKRPRRGNELVMSIELANQIIYELAKKNEDYHGMGTTVVAARFLPRKRRVFIGHVGDSRCYRYRRGTLTQLTTDHTLGNTGVPGPFSGHLSRALGVRSKVPVDLVVDAPQDGDVYLLCSDGLTKMVSTEVLKSALHEPANLSAKVKTLLDLANESGGRDNTTVVLVSVKNARAAAA